MESGSERVLERVLGDLEKKRKRIWITKGVLEFLFVLFVSLGVATLLSHVYINNTYFSVLKFTVLLATCFGLGWFLIPALLKKEEKTRLALELDKISPGLGENTLNAVLLSNEVKSEKEFGVSQPLIEAHIDEVTRRLGSLDISPAVPIDKVKGYWKPLAVAFVLSVTALILAPGEFRSFLFSFNLLPTSKPHLLQFADIKIEYNYPAYTKLQPQVIKGSSGDIKAIKGTHVTFKATPLGSLTDGEIVVENGFNVPVSYEGEKIRGEFTILSDGSFFVQGESGKFKSEIFGITVEKDRSPIVTAETQGEDIIEIEDQENLEIFYRAGDDFGLTKLLLTWSGDKDKGNRLIKQTKKEPKSLEGNFTWDFSGVESEPGEIIEVQIKAYDNDTVSGPKVGVSNTIKVRLNDPREKHENILALAQRALERLLDTLAEDIQYRPGNNIETSAITKVQHGATSKIEQTVSLLSQILDKMEDDDYSDYTYFLELANMRTRIEDVLNQRRDLLQLFSSADLPKLDDLITAEINEFEDDILFLDSMLRGERLRESLFYGRDTFGKYNELRELLQSFKENGDEETRREIEQKIRELRSLVSQLTEKLSSIDEDIQEEFLNADAFQVTDLQGEMDRIRELIEQGKIDDALELLAGLEKSLEGMIASIENGVQSFSSASFSEEIKKLNDLVSKIDELEKDERSLKEKSEKLKKALVEEQQEKENLAEFVRREKEKLEELRNLLTEAKAKVSDDTTEGRPSEESLLIDRLLGETNMLEHWLQAFEFKEALEDAKEVHDRAVGLKNLSDLGAGNLPKADQEIGESASIAGEIRQDLEQLQQQVSQERMQQLAEGQDEIEKETSGLADSFGDSGQSDFSLPEEIGEKLQESRGFMQGASDSLRRKEISKAISNQEEAIKSLKGAKEGAEGLLQKFQLSARGKGLSVPMVLGRNQFRQEGLGIDTSRVDIPPPAESETGKELKKNLLEALKDGSPKGFEELNKRYYEKIVK